GVIVILLDRHQDEWLAKWSGADAWFVKPFDPFALARRVVDLLQAKEPAGRTKARAATAAESSSFNRCSSRRGTAPGVAGRSNRSTRPSSSTRPSTWRLAGTPSRA